MAKACQDRLDPDPGIFIPVRERELLLTEMDPGGVQGRGPQDIVKILFSRRGPGNVHGVVDVVHIQVVPGDVIHLKILFMTQIVLADLCIALRHHDLPGRLSVGFFQFGLKFCRPPPAIRDPRPQKDGGQQGYKGNDHISVHRALVHPLFHHMVLILIDMEGGDAAPDHGDRVNVGMSADHGAGV